MRFLKKFFKRLYKELLQRLKDEKIIRDAERKAFVNEKIKGAVAKGKKKAHRDPYENFKF